MKPKTDAPFVPDHIQGKIQQLHELLDEAEELYVEILEWYDHELQTYDPAVDSSLELFDPRTGSAMKRISYHVVMEGLSVLQVANETD